MKQSCFAGLICLFIHFNGWGQPTPSQQPVLGYRSVQLLSIDGKQFKDLNMLWITPGSKSLYESDGSPLYLSLSKNGVDVQHINEVVSKKPTILVINYTNPWVIDEVYNTSTQSNIVGVLATFGTTQDALLEVMTGKFNPTGKMPFTTPISEDQAQQQQSDVPGYLKGKQYGLFWYDEGLRYRRTR